MAAPDTAVVHVVPFGKVTPPLVALVANVTGAPGTGFWLASVTVAVKVVVVVPSAVVVAVGGVSVTAAAGPATSVSWLDPETEPVVAVIVSVSALVEAVMVTEQVPVESVVQVPLLEKWTPCPLARPLANVIVTFGTTFPLVSTTVALAFEADVPSAMILAGFSVTDTAVGAPAVCVRTAGGDVTLFELVAVMFCVPAVFEDVMVTAQVPTPGPDLAVVQIPPAAKLAALTPPSVAKVTDSPGTSVPSASLTVAVADDVEVPSATIEAGVRTTETAVAGPASVSGAVPDPAPTRAVMVSP